MRTISTDNVYIHLYEGCSDNYYSMKIINITPIYVTVNAKISHLSNKNLSTHYSSIL